MRRESISTFRTSQPPVSWCQSRDSRKCQKSRKSLKSWQLKLPALCLKVTKSAVLHETAGCAQKKTNPRGHMIIKANFIFQDIVWAFCAFLSDGNTEERLHIGWKEWENDKPTDLVTRCFRTNCHLLISFFYWASSTFTSKYFYFLDSIQITLFELLIKTCSRLFY